MTETRDDRDIVDRLRHAPVVFGTEMFGATRLLEDAAAEIERLRSQRVAVPEGWCLVPVESIEGERDRVIEECARIAETRHEDDNGIDQLIKRRIASAIRALAHGDSNDR